MNNRNDTICPPINMKIGEVNNVKMNVEKTDDVAFSLGDRSVSVPSYSVLPDKPKINGVTLIGDKTIEELGVVNDKNYVHNQTTSSDTWIIEHNLNKYPTVNVMDSASEEVIGEVIYNSVNQLTIRFAAAFKGKAILN